MLNRTIMQGRLVGDPTLRQTKAATPVSVCSFRIACDRDYGTKEERKTDFVDCTAWRSTADFVSKYFHKGEMIIVDGRIQDKEWTDKEGIKRRDKEINVDNAYFGDSKKPEAGGAGEASNGYGGPAGGNIEEF